MASILSQPQFVNEHIDGLVQDCSNSSASEMELLQSCAKSSILRPEENGYNFADDIPDHCY